MILKRTVMTSALGLIGVVLMACPPASGAELSCPAGNVACLIAAIQTANGNGEANTLTLAAGTYTLTTVNNETDGANGLPSITSPLTIRGAGTTATSIERASYAPPFRIVHVAATGTLTLNGVTIRGGNALERGGGIFTNGGTLVILHSTISGNTAGRFDGAVAIFGGKLTLRSSAITDNRAEEVAGGIGSDFGTLTITNSTISGNMAEQTGGIYSALSTLTITSSTFSNNTAWLLQGGAIFNDRSTLRLINSTLVHNTSGLRGGAIYNEQGTLTVTGSTISQNAAVTGGGIENIGGTVAMQNTTLAENTTLFLNYGPDCRGSITSLGHNIIGDTTDCTISLLASDLTRNPASGTFTEDGSLGH
jgi:hypothetical protein